MRPAWPFGCKHPPGCLQVMQRAGSNMRLGVLGRGLRDIGFVALSAVAAVWIIQHPEDARRALGLHGFVPAVGTEHRTVPPIESRRRPQGFERTVTLKAGHNGHFYTSAEVNGRPVDVIVDTGASLVSLSYDDARQAGIYLTDADYKYRSNTANGTARIAIVALDRVQIGDIEVRNVQAAVAEPGKLFATLLGMSFLAKLQRFEMRGGELLLVE